ncbi:MAG: RNA polymerase sigma factor [Planctomycetota bacterium]
MKPESLCQIWDQCSERLGVIARGLGEGAEDAMQEAFVELAKQTQLPTDPLAWLVRVMRNRFFDRFRGEQRRKRREQKYSEARDTDATIAVQSVGDKLIEAENYSAVSACLNDLPMDQREILVMHVWGEMSFAQIAEATSRSASGCHRMYQVALKAIGLAMRSEADDWSHSQPDPGTASATAQPGNSSRI